MDESRGTRAAYARIAADYASANSRRDQLRRHALFFGSLLTPGARVLDVGCGPGLDAALLEEQGLRVTGVDYSWEQMVVGRDQHQVTCDFIQADMRQLPLVCSADGLWLCASFLHLPRREAAAALAELARVLKPGGILFMSVKQGDGEGWSNHTYGRAAPRFFTFWQPHTLDPLLAAAGFEIIEGWLDAAAEVTWLVRFARRKQGSADD